VVIGILGLLVAILVPFLSKARAQTRRTTCANNLRQVGTALLNYMHENKDRMPHISYMPSVGPAPLTTDEPVYFADVLKRHLNGQEEVFRCPDDKPGKNRRPAPNTGLSYFKSERSSYEYRVRLGGLTPGNFYQAVGPPWRQETDKKVAPHTVWMARDYENFHGEAGKIGARRYVYFDGHVADYEN
jgi:type II secretory pathway pseudopilin PulG